MKIATLVSSIDPAVGGGVAESVIKLNRYLIKNSDVSAEIFSLKHPNSKIDLISGVETRLHNFMIHGYMVSLRDLRKMYCIQKLIYCTYMECGNIILLFHYPGKRREENILFQFREC